MNKVSEKLDNVYSFISDFINSNGYPPTVREICNHLNISSTATAYSYIEKLEKCGRINRDQNKNRAISICKPFAPVGVTPTPTQIPLVGTVSAGKGIFAEENIEAYFPMPSSLFKGNNLFMLRVKGDSMIDVGISDGDYVVVKQQNDVDDDEIAVVLFEDLATVKRIHKTPTTLILHPENNTMQDIVLDRNSNPLVLGQVVGCIKKF